MKCGSIYKKVESVADGQYEGTISGYEIKFKTTHGEFMTEWQGYGIRGIDVPVVITIKGNEIEVEVKQ